MMSRFCSLMHPIVEANEYPQPAPYVSVQGRAESNRPGAAARELLRDATHTWSQARAEVRDPLRR
jgi:hypothetical protein